MPWKNGKTGYPSKDELHLEGAKFLERHPLVAPMSMLKLFELLNHGHMNEVAVEQGGKTYTKRELRDDAEAIARSLLAFGLSRYSVVGIVTPNCYRGIAICMAANAIGVSTIFLNPEDSAETIGMAIEDFGIDMLIIKGRDDAFRSEVAQYVPTIMGWIVDVDDDSEYNNLLLTANYCAKSVARRELLMNMFFNEPTIFLQTSGSATGRPKILPFSNSNIFAALMYCSNSSGIKVCDPVYSRCLVILPYRIPYGWTMIFMNLIGGQTVVLADGADAKSVGEYHKYNVDVIYGTPTILRGIIQNSSSVADFSRLKIFYSGGFSLPEHLEDEAQRFFAQHEAPREVQILSDYGIGEGLCMGTDTKPGTFRVKGTVGRFYLGPKWLIVDENLNEVKYDEVGEIIVSSKSLCHGYVGEPELTAAAFFKKDGQIWYRTGDFAKMDMNGNVTFVGRKKRFFQPLGATDKVNCETVEQAFLKCPLAKECAVVPVPDAKNVVVGKAFVVLNREDVEREFGVDEAALDYLRKFVQRELLDFQVPHKIVAIEKLPMMSSGKVDYVKLEKM